MAKKYAPRYDTMPPTHFTYIVVMQSALCTSFAIANIIYYFTMQQPAIAVAKMRAAQKKYDTLNVRCGINMIT